MKIEIKKESCLLLILLINVVVVLGDHIFKTKHIEVIAVQEVSTFSMGMLAQLILKGIVRIAPVRYKQAQKLLNDKLILLCVIGVLSIWFFKMEQRLTEMIKSGSPIAARFIL